MLVFHLDLVSAPDSSSCVFLFSPLPRNPRACVCVHPMKEKHGAEVFSFGVSAVQTPFVKPG